MVVFVDYKKAMESIKNGKVAFFYYGERVARVDSETDLESLRRQLMAHMTLTISDVTQGDYTIHDVHRLKIHPEYFDAVLKGEKTFEIRKNDRNYQVGDFLILQEFDPVTNEYTGEEVERRITYITAYAQQDNYVVLAIK